MTQASQAYIELIVRCQRAIVIIRSLRLARADDPAVEPQLVGLMDAVTPLLVREARRLRAISPLLEEEALEMMNERLVIDVFSGGYISLETQFGAYLRTMPLYIRRILARKSSANGALLTMTSLDAVDDNGLPAHETIADERAELPIIFAADRLELDALIERLPPDERHALRMRHAGAENNEIASSLGISQATATRLYQRALGRLRGWLER